ncbi:MAG TPA: hypothetical protein VOA80_10495 [Thermoanaerobaculia bacterium]|nr:hypothetical protein [Thermoanaerobaculia bacterium]
MNITWKFPRNDGGRETGFSDAGVETFKGNTDKYLAREMLQNSLDARYDPNKPVRVEFRVRKLKGSDIPDLKSLKATLSRCSAFFHDEKKAVDFFTRAEELAGTDEIQALEVGDYNTTGVRGADHDRTKEWYKLIRCAGSSSKGGGEGGSFGIGKNAPFAASRLRTVLYSTRTIDGEHAFQGVATLVSHHHPEGGIAQPTGFLGAANGMAVRVPTDIPKLFRRSECGLDITVLGFSPGFRWADDLTYSVLDNFWPAIEFGDIEVRVGDRYISKATLPGLLEEFSGAEDFTAHLYYRAFKNPTMLPVKEDLPILGECTVYLLAGAAEVMPKKVAMIRKTGMKIYEKAFRSIVPYCGVFICRSDQGNRVLREMEPPKHDIWDPDHPEKGAQKKTYTELINFIRSCLKSLLPADDTKAIAVPGLQRYLPDDDETPEESFDEAGPQQTAESFRRQLIPGKIEGRTIEFRRAMQPDESKPELHGDATEEPGEGEGSGGAPGAGSNLTDGGTGGGGGGIDTGRAKGTDGAAGGGSSRPSVSIRYRAFPTNSGAGVYKVVVAAGKPPASGKLNLALWAVGDDRKEPVEVRSARLLDGTELLVGPNGLIGPIVAAEADGIKLEVILRHPVRVAMEVAAYEA